MSVFCNSLVGNRRWLPPKAIFVDHIYACSFWSRHIFFLGYFTHFTGGYPASSPEHKGVGRGGHQGPRSTSPLLLLLSSFMYMALLSIGAPLNQPYVCGLVVHNGHLLPRSAVVDVDLTQGLPCCYGDG